MSCHNLEAPCLLLWKHIFKFSFCSDYCLHLKCRAQTHRFNTIPGCTCVFSCLQHHCGLDFCSIIVLLSPVLPPKTSCHTFATACKFFYSRSAPGFEYWCMMYFTGGSNCWFIGLKVAEQVFYAAGLTLATLNNTQVTSSFKKGSICV